MSDDRTEYEQVYDPGAADERTEDQKAVDKKAEDRRMLLGRMLATPEVREWLWELLQESHAFEVRFGGTGYSPDPMGTWLFAGEQRVGWWIWTQLDDASPELASLMRREHK